MYIMRTEPARKKQIIHRKYVPEHRKGASFTASVRVADRVVSAVVQLLIYTVPAASKCGNASVRSPVYSILDHSVPDGRAPFVLLCPEIVLARQSVT